MSTPKSLMSFKLTYSTMFDPPEELHVRFEAALADVRARLGGTHPMFVAGHDKTAARTFEKRNPADHRQILGRFPLCDHVDVNRAMEAAKNAFPGWRATSGAERMGLLRRASEIIEERVYAIGAALSLDVGKNRMEALGEAQETADFFSRYAAEFERNHGFDQRLPDDPVAGYRSHNRSVLKPYGVWVVISPFNFPLALAGGPVAAALVTGNTVVWKGPTDAPWAGRLLADCLRDAGFPAGVANYVSGTGVEAGEALTTHPDVAGITFTGSYEVGMGIYRAMSAGRYPRPCIAEMGGKNACIVTAGADLERAALGIVRSAYGLSGQKCSALSRVYVQDAIADSLLEKVREKLWAIRVGDPSLRANWMGPVISEQAAQKYVAYCADIVKGGGRIIEGGARLAGAEFDHGYFVPPTLAEAPPDHPLFQEEMFLPVLMVACVANVREAVALANAVPYGLTAGCYGSVEEVRYFLDHAEAGVLYVNRPQGATTGAWPGYQPFGGWKGSGSTGKAIGSSYYLPLYMREQSQTIVE